MVTSLLLAVSLVGQAPEMPSNYQHMKAAEWLIGDWEGESSADESLPMLKHGEKLLLTVSWKWALNKNIITVDWSVAKASDRKPLVTGKGMIGWGPANERIVIGGFDSIGGHTISTFVEKDGTWYQESKGVEVDGTKTSGTLVWSDIKPDSISVQDVDRKRGDEELPDGPKMTLKRVK